jgi:hypothetical protein
MPNIFQDPTKTLPMKADDQLVRVDMEQSDLQGRKSHLPGQQKSDKMSVSHVPNAGSAR